MNIIHLALGGCMKAPPVDFGLTADTGGHIAYVLDAAAAQAARADVDGVEIVTRLIDDPGLGPAYAMPHEIIGDKLSIRRIATLDRRYLEKEALGAELPYFTEAFCIYLNSLPRHPDLIHAHFGDAGHVAAEAFRRCGIPFVYTPHALGIDKSLQGGLGLETRIERERDAISRAHAIIVSSRDEADRQVRAYAVPGVEARVYCIPPGVPVRAAAGGGDAIVDHLDRWLDEPHKPILLVIARPVAKKNIAALLRGYAATPALRAVANIVILAGQRDSHASPEEVKVIAELRALSETPVLRGRIALPDRHSEADVAALYSRAAASGVFVNPALHEPFGLTILEAAAAGVPVVATKAGGPAEIVARIGHGLLVDPRDDVAIAGACLRIIENPDLHRSLSDAGPAGAGSYDWKRYAAVSTRIYASLLPDPGLLACDIDNTLTGCPTGARAFAAWATTRTIPFIVATGRSFDEAVAVLGHWQLPEPDAYIVDVGTRIMLRDPTGAWRACADFASALDCDWDRSRVMATLDPLGLEAQPEVTQTPHKLSFFGSARTASLIRTALHEAGLAARVIHSHGHFLDVLPPSGGKAAAIAFHARRFGLPMSGCIAAGDSGNDADMLAACGRAVVVANADNDLSGLPARRGLYRAMRPHADGVLEGLAAFGLAPAIRRPAA